MSVLFALVLGSFGYAYRVDTAADKRLTQAVEDRNQRIRDNAQADDYRWNTMNTRYDDCSKNLQDLRERMRIVEYRLDNKASGR
jgi:hypothetical protein